MFVLPENGHDGEEENHEFCSDYCEGYAPQRTQSCKFIVRLRTILSGTTLLQKQHYKVTAIHLFIFFFNLFFI